MPPWGECVMHTLYVAQRGAVVRRVGLLIRLEDRDGQCLGRYSPPLLQQVFLFGDVSITMPTIHFLADHAIPVALLSSTSTTCSGATRASRPAGVARRRIR